MMHDDICVNPKRLQYAEEAYDQEIVRTRYWSPWAQILRALLPSSKAVNAMLPGHLL